MIANISWQGGTKSFNRQGGYAAVVHAFFCSTCASSPTPSTIFQCHSLQYEEVVAVYYLSSSRLVLPLGLQNTRSLVTHMFFPNTSSIWSSTSSVFNNKVYAYIELHKEIMVSKLLRQKRYAQASKFPQNELKAWSNPSGKSHPCKIGTSSTFSTFPLSYTPKGRRHLRVYAKVEIFLHSILKS